MHQFYCIMILYYYTASNYSTTVTIIESSTISGIRPVYYTVHTTVPAFTTTPVADSPGNVTSITKNIYMSNIHSQICIYFTVSVTVLALIAIIVFALVVVLLCTTIAVCSCHHRKQSVIISKSLCSTYIHVCSKTASFNRN